MIELINASKEAGLGAAVFAAIEGADVDGELDGNWGQKSIDAAARGGADLVYAISNAFGENIKVADVRGLAALAQKVAQKLQHSTDDFEKIDHERTRLERLKSFAISALGPLVTVLVTGLCLSVVGAAATASMGAAAVAGAGCGTIGGAAGRFADGLNRTGSVEVAFDAALDGERMAYDAAAGLAGGALGYASMPKAPFGATKTSGQPVPSSTRPPAPATNTVDPNTVRFSQDSARATFRDGRSVADMSADLKSGALNPSDVPPIRLVDQGGELFTLDNRRLIAFQDAGVQVPFRMATASEITKDAFKFTSQNGGTSIQLRFW
jgi:hypothetical protein